MQDGHGMRSTMPAPERLLQRIDQGLAWLGLARTQALRVALGFAIGIAGALAFNALRLPLPWFLGPLTFCLLAAVVHAPIERPAFLSVPMRVILGLAVGSAFTPALFAKLGAMTWSLLLLVPFMLLIMAGGTWFFERYAGYERPTAFFCAVPGGLADMTSMAADAGANTRAVTLIQATRIVLLVFTVPLWLQLIGGHGVAGLAPRGIGLGELLLVDAVVLALIGWVGWKLARRIRLAGAPLVGPMILGGLAHAAGLTAAKVPVEVLITAQVTIGVMLGTQFRGLTLAELRSTMAWGIAYALVLLVAAAVLSLIVSWLTGFDATTVLLAYAPGGQAELNLLAYLLGLDAAFTALHHLVRLAIVIFGAQIVFAANRSWRKEQGEG
jgi:hypothetical protein